MNHPGVLVLALGAALLATGPAAAGDPVAGREKAAKTCAACHGPDGNSQAPDFPRLAGQHYDYLVKALNDYKSGARKNPIMAGQVGNLKPQDLNDLAAFYSSQPGLAVKY